MSKMIVENNIDGKLDVDNSKEEAVFRIEV